MHRLPRTSTRLTRFSPTTSLARTSRCVRPYAQQSYGGEDMTGHPQSDQPNPKSHLEHPGPKSPSTKGGSHQEVASSPPSQSSASPKAGDPKASSENSDRASPKVNDPGPAPQNANAEVRKHNEEMARRYDRPANQIDEDGKVEKGFWSSQYSACCKLWQKSGTDRFRPTDQTGN